MPSARHAERGLLGDQPARSTTRSRAQPFPGNVIPRERWDPAAARILDDLSPSPTRRAGVHAPRGQTIENYVINPEPGAGGRPVRRQARPRPEPGQPLLRSLQLPEEPPLPSRRPAPGRRLRKRRHRHQGPERRLQRHPHLRPALAQRAAARLHVLRLRSVPQRGRRERRGADGHPQRELQRLHLGHEPDQLPACRACGTWAAVSPCSRTWGHLQLLDNMTHVRGRHTLKAGASVTFRSREILISDGRHRSAPSSSART